MNVHEKDILVWWRYSWTLSCEKMSAICDELSTFKHPVRALPDSKNKSKYKKTNLMDH